MRPLSHKAGAGATQTVGAGQTSLTVQTATGLAEGAGSVDGLHMDPQQIIAGWWLAGTVSAPSVCDSGAVAWQFFTLRV